jgi:hypothetical protein
VTDHTNLVKLVAISGINAIQCPCRSEVHLDTRMNKILYLYHRPMATVRKNATTQYRTERQQRGQSSVPMRAPLHVAWDSSSDHQR